MTPHERQIIDNLFDKVREVEQQSGPREPMAEAHIHSRVQQPGASYYMAQTIVMQEQALQTAQARIAELEDEVARRPAGGGFLSGLFGGGSPPQARPPQRHPDNMQAMAPPSTGFGSGILAPGMTTQPGRGGFLAGAAQTAAGVAGSMMLGSLLGHVLGGDGGAKAAEAAQPTPAAAPAASADDGTLGEDLGGDLDDISV